MIEKMARAGSTFDWITPLWMLIQAVRHWPTRTINIPWPSHMTSTQVVSDLRCKGVGVYGSMLIGDEFVIQVRQAQARYAAHWLAKWGLL